MNQETYKQFKEKVLHPQDDLFAILFINFITCRIAYLIKRFNLNVDPNRVTYSRMLIIAPILIVLLLLAPLYNGILFYTLALIVSYLFIASDWLDGQIARGMGKTSAKGAFLDSVADRCSTILFMVLLFSMGLWFQSTILVYGAIVLSTLKIFHLMVITKLFYYGIEEGKGNAQVFDGSDAGLSIIDKIFGKIKKIIRVKRWDGTLGGAERFFFTIMLPLILVLSNLNRLTITLLTTYIFIFGMFFIIRIRNLFRRIEW